MTDDRHAELDRITIGGARRHDAPIVLAAHDPEWRRLYEREARRKRGVLGDRVRVLEHAGSTLVPGLAAKPVIDIRRTGDLAYRPPSRGSVTSGPIATAVRCHSAYCATTPSSSTTSSASNVPLA